jgi:hypothetical protein
MKSVVAIIVALGLAIAFTSPTLASGGKGAELYNAAANKADCENLPNGKWDDKTNTCSKGQ